MSVRWGDKLGYNSTVKELILTSRGTSSMRSIPRYKRATDALKMYLGMRFGDSAKIRTRIELSLPGFFVLDGECIAL